MGSAEASLETTTHQMTHFPRTHSVSEADAVDGAAEVGVPEHEESDMTKVSVRLRVQWHVGNHTGFMEVTLRSRTVSRRHGTAGIDGCIPLIHSIEYGETGIRNTQAPLTSMNSTSEHGFRSDGCVIRIPRLYSSSRAAISA